MPKTRLAHKQGHSRLKPAIQFKTARSRLRSFTSSRIEAAEARRTGDIADEAQAIVTLVWQRCSAQTRPEEGATKESPPQPNCYSVNVPQPLY